MIGTPYCAASIKGSPKPSPSDAASSAAAAAPTDTDDAMLTTHAVNLIALAGSRFADIQRITNPELIGAVAGQILHRR